VTSGDAAADPDAGAAEAEVLTIAEGFSPDVALDASGTAYLAWYGTEPSTNTLQFCRLPRGATTCERRLAIPALGTTLTRPFVIVDGATVRVVSHRYGLSDGPFEAVYLFSSADRGDTWSGGTVVGTVPWNDAMVGPGAAVSLVTSAFSEGTVYERVPLGGSPAPTTRAVLSADRPYGGTVGLLDPVTPIVAYADGAGDAQIRRVSGAGEPNDVASWAAPVPIGHAEYMHMAKAPAGLFLGARSAEGTFVVRKFDGTTFGPPVNVPEGTGELPQAHLTSDPAGRLHAVWPRIDADGIRVYHATSDDGAAWQTRRVTTSREEIRGMRVAASTDHAGVAAWDTGPTTKTIALVRIAE